MCSNMTRLSNKLKIRFENHLLIYELGFEQAPKLLVRSFAVLTAYRTTENKQLDWVSKTLGIMWNNRLS